MKRTPYNKLVRDRIPEIITTQGKTSVTKVLSDDQYLTRLDRKLLEETNVTSAIGLGSEINL